VRKGGTGMIQSWKEILPGDRYEVRAAGLLCAYDQKLVTCLYQPLVGIEATSLYFTFWQDQQDSAEEAISATHHQLMSFMNLSLDRILKARKKLEAVGLLRSFKKKNADPDFFIYQMNPPLQPDQFFHDGLLSVFLYHQIGPRDYQRLSSLFKVKQQISPEDCEDVSSAFNDVFEAVPQTEADEKQRLNSGTSEWAKRAAAPGARIRHTFDFKALKGYLSEAIVSGDALTAEVRAAVEKLAFIYQTDPFDMSRAIETASLETGYVDIESLRKEVRDFYRLEHGADELPALYERTQPAADREMAGKKPETEEERLILWYESNSPYQLLEQLGNGSKPQPPDLRLIENLMFTTKLSPGVINVLIDYIVHVNHNNLNQSFVEKIAAQWARSNIHTVRQAMSVARAEQKKRRNRDTRKKPAAAKATGREHQEVVPEWMKKPSGAKSTQIPDEEARKRAKWLDDYLNNI
jgi:Replication initiation/membrane attachment protein